MPADGAYEEKVERNPRDLVLKYHPPVNRRVRLLSGLARRYDGDGILIFSPNGSVER